MTCSQLDLSLLLHAHEQPGGAPKLFLEAHLKRCPHCRERWARWTLERNAMRHALAPLGEDAGAAERLRTAVAIRIRTEPREAPLALSPPSGRGRSRAGRGVLLLAAMLLAIAVSALAAFWDPSVLPSRVADAPPGTHACPPPEANGPEPAPAVAASLPNAPAAGRNGPACGKTAAEGCPACANRPAPGGR